MLYERYRPRHSAGFAGDAARVARILEAWPIDGASCHLFSGPSGSGKSSLAHMFAARVADARWGLQVMDCGGQAGAAGRSLRDQLIDWLRLSPCHGAGKAVILEECHNLSRSSQESLLGVLESVPRRRLVLATTTEPARLCHALRSRFHHWELKPPTRNDAVAQLEMIAARESIAATPADLRRLAEDSAMRDEAGAHIAYNLRAAVDNLERFQIMAAALAVSAA